jgi:hypothetical protein
MSWDGKVGICTAGNPMSVFILQPLDLYRTAGTDIQYDDILKVEIMTLDEKLGWSTNILYTILQFYTII